MRPKHALTTFSIIVFGLAAGSASAGPDWAAIERARAAKQAEPPNSVEPNIRPAAVQRPYGPRPQARTRYNPAPTVESATVKEAAVR